MKHEKIKLEQTCVECPEQHDRGSLLKLQEDLSLIGEILVIKDDTVFTLLMKIPNNLARQVFQIGKLVSDYVGNRKENVEVVYNNENTVLLVLKS
ncbi:hypothetical protein J2810_004609 [Chryseobacterium rhizosphaerae]|uniref:hypothetical protein n=1 Tax=Chryseobacterium rhizosphaerae TaxID=395937 RepID=UPI002855889D|nr:hypothetical protein [Chryseobacterium rhizosphaerae]MDR6548519.1 hypothetical protein [Chryseobacterium rhizosphaerae]